MSDPINELYRSIFDPVLSRCFDLLIERGEITMSHDFVQVKRHKRKRQNKKYLKKYGRIFSFGSIDRFKYIGN